MYLIRNWNNEHGTDKLFLIWNHRLAKVPEKDTMNAEVALRARLNELAQQHSQAEIARRCRTKRNNVSRYLKDTRVPTTFCIALVREFGVNPAWLMTGEGARYLSDTAAGNERLAANLLDLVQSMRAVERMKLGSLSGKHHLKVLRALNDAMRDFDSLRERLKLEAEPVFIELLERYQTAIEKRRVEEADDLSRALKQVSALCQDEELEIEFIRLQALYENNHGDLASAIDLQNRAFRKSFAARIELTETLCTEAAHLSIMLRRMDRAREALHVTRATAALADDPPPTHAAFQWLRCMQASAEFAIGRIDLGYPRFMSAYSRLDDEARAGAQNILARFLLVSGTAGPRQILAMSEETPIDAWQYLLPFFVWLEDPDELAWALGRLRTVGIPATAFIVQAAAALLDAKRGGKAWRKFLDGAPIAAEVGKGPGSPGLRARVLAAQIARAAGDARRAKVELLAAHNLLAAFDPACTPGLMTWCTLMRETLHVIPAGAKDAALASIRRDAAGFIRQWHDRGYMFLGPCLELAA
jgi:hypothetical protein